jgi:hypothetical protein
MPTKHTTETTAAAVKPITTYHEAEAAGRAAYEAAASGKAIPTPAPAREADASGKPSPGPTPAPTPGRQLSPLQILIIDELADLLLYGGHDEDTIRMLSAAAGHMVRRGERHSEGFIPEAIEIDVNIWKRKLPTIQSRARATAPPTEPTVNTVKERARATVLERLRKHLLEFTARSTPEEARFMLSVLEYHEGSCHGRDNFDELVIADAFEAEIRRGEFYDFVRVPSGMKRQVEKYIECLRATARPDLVA